MRLKGSGCLFPCTPCMVERDNSWTTAGAAAPSRDVEATVKSQLSNATMGTFWGAASRRAEVEMEHSLNSVVPAVAAWAGLGNGPQMLYRLPGLDRLHVRSLALYFMVALPCVSPLRPFLWCASPHLAPLGVFYLVWALDMLLKTAHLTAPLRIFVVLVTWTLLAHFYIHANVITQVMDSGINRKVANRVPLYLRQVAGASGHTRFDTAANTERAMNLLFQYASRKLRVPHIHAGYVVCGRSAGVGVLSWCGRCSCGVGAIKGLRQREPRRSSLIRTSFFLCTAGTLYQNKKKQATRTGSEHRRALPFFPFALVGVAGSDGDGVYHSTLTLAICELVHVIIELFSARCTGGGIALAEADMLTTKAHKSVVDHYQTVLGPSHTTKLHRMAAHLLDEFRLRGNLHDSNTAQGGEKGVQLDQQQERPVQRAADLGGAGLPHPPR